MVLGGTSLSPRYALAASDEAVASAVDRVMASDFANANYGAARGKLRTLIDKCKQSGCTAQALAQVHVALGMVAVQIGQGDQGKAEFLDALNGYATAQLPSAGVTQAIKD